MRLFSRLGDMLDANISQLLKRAKRPGLTARKMVSEIEDTLAQIKLAASEVLNEKAQLVSSLSNFRKKESEWHERAILALGREREDLAREALEQKMVDCRKAEAIEKRIESLQSSIDQYQLDIRKLEEKLCLAQTGREAYKADRVNLAKQGLEQTLEEGAGTDTHEASPWVQLDRMTQFSKELSERSREGKTPE